jgi:hypothetical protein
MRAAFGRLFLCVTCIRHFRNWHQPDLLERSDDVRSSG